MSLTLQSERTPSGHSSSIIFCLTWFFFPPFSPQLTPFSVPSWLLKDGLFYEEYRKAGYRGLVIASKAMPKNDDATQLTFAVGQYILVREAFPTKNLARGLLEDGISEGW
jgi:hypothetical protein